jgi:AraC family ethanolamine operon transcriptional activator
MSEPPPFTPGMGGTVRTSDVDRLHDLAPGWVQQSFQLGRGQFEGSLSFGQTGRMQFAVKDWRPGLLVRGSAPDGAAVLGFPLVDSTAGRLRGLSLASNDFGYITNSEEVDFRSTTPYRVFLIAMREEELEAYAEIVLGRPLRSLVRAHRLHGGRSVEERQREVERLGLDAVYRATHKLIDPRVAGWVENRILDSLLSGLPFDERRRHVPGSAALARRAEDYLLTNLQAPLTIRDLCQAMRASERTLHLAFKVHLGTTPKAHLKTLRLNAVRRELRHAGPGVGVMDVAMRWGFFHAGWLSQDYRRMFGESPSKALPPR